MAIPDDLRYSPDHEWAARRGTRVRIGITDYAQRALGDIVFVQLPEVGSVVVAGDPMSEVESTKSVSDVFAALSGTVVEVNEHLASEPALLNSDPYGRGWICEIEPSDLDQFDRLLDAGDYGTLIDG